MQVQKKYKQILYFIKIVNKNNDANNLVNISENDFNILKDFVLSLNIDNEGNYIEPIYQEVEIVGPQGPKGDTGATGPQGPKGDTGTFDDSTLENYATKEYVNNKLAELIGGAPETYDTLQEIAAWINEYGDITIPSNVVTSNVEGLQINAVYAMPSSPDENTLYIVQ